MKTENKKMKAFLKENGIEAKRIKYISKGSLKKTWAISGFNAKWDDILISKLTSLGFSNFEYKLLNMFSGQAYGEKEGQYSIFLTFKNTLEMINYAKEQ